MNQIPLSKCPKSLTEEVAVLEQEPEYFEQRGILTFEEEYDDLDYYKAAVFTDSAGQAFGLKRYRHLAPPWGVSLIVAKSDAVSLRVQVIEALKLLGLSSEDVIWTRDDVQWSEEHT